MDVVGAAEAREILGVELQRISRWRRNGKLPPPYADLASSPVWLREDIERIAKDDSEQSFTPPPDPPTLMGTSEAAARLNVSKSQIVRWRANKLFPDPCARIKAGPIWRTVDIEQFATGRKHRAAA